MSYSELDSVWRDAGYEITENKLRYIVSATSQTVIVGTMITADAQQSL